MHLLATEHPFRWQPHPEIWVLMVGILGLAVYAVRVIGPRATHDDEVVVTRSQKAWFFSAWVVRVLEPTFWRTRSEKHVRNLGSAFSTLPMQRRLVRLKRRST